MAKPKKQSQQKKRKSACIISATTAVVVKKRDTEGTQSVVKKVKVPASIEHQEGMTIYEHKKVPPGAIPDRIHYSHCVMQWKNMSDARNFYHRHKKVYSIRLYTRVSPTATWTLLEQHKMPQGPIANAAR